MAGSGRGLGGVELARVVRSGSFAEVLDAAISACGLTLDRVRFHLGERGVDVSAATLSYWRHGKRRPERQESLRAVQALEALLGLPAATLITLLGPPRPRGRWSRRPEWGAAGLLSQFADPDEGEYGLVSAHDVFTVAEDRSDRGVRSRIVLRGEHGRVTRCLVKYRADDPAYPPALTDVRFCRPGRVLTDEATGLIVAELLLDRPLAVGGHAVVEYDMVSTPGPPVETYYRQFVDPVAEYSQQVQFLGAPPARCHSFRKADLTGTEHRVDRLDVGPSRSSCLVGFNVSPGVVGTRWSW
ncbi:XRE family transcriptional regulator [Actinosynnema sp. NPDC020468]|uniref:XRE family transcriptional regulator n=1 Tax=Actinosynnema sp. NPDC020468 TaxID=3154488 RepID=UPI0033C54F36